MKTYITQRQKGSFNGGQAEGFFSYSPTMKENKDADEGVISFRLTDKTLDRYSEVVMPKGAQIKNFKKNPVFLWAHNFDWANSQAPIGKILTDTIEITDDFFDADVKFDMNDEFAVLIYNKFKEKFLNAGSIGFRPIDISREAEVPGQKGVTHTKWELLEFSGVPIPANPSALAKRSFGEFAGKCKEMGHPIGEILDQYYSPQPYFYGEEIATLDNNTEFNCTGIQEVDEIKAGKVLSKKNRELIKSTVGAMETVMEGLNNLLSATEESTSSSSNNYINDEVMKKALDQIKLFDLKKDFGDIIRRHK